MDYLYPSSDGVLIPGKRGKLFGHLYLPGGPYPRPVVLLGHGIPGNERLFDFSIALREQGFCTVNFHYSGSWGSDGDYAIPHCFEDIGSAVEYIQRNENGWFDLDNFFYVGHSLGGLMGAYAVSSFDVIKGGVLLAPYDLLRDVQPMLRGEPGTYMESVFSDASGDKWLRNYSREDFIHYVSAEPARYALCSYAEGLAKKRLLVFTAEKDAVCPPAEHGGALADAVAKAGGRVTHKCYDDDHCFNTHRAEVRRDVTEFLSGLVK